MSAQVRPSSNEGGSITESASFAAMTSALSGATRDSSSTRCDASVKEPRSINVRTESTCAGRPRTDVRGQELSLRKLQVREGGFPASSRRSASRSPLGRLPLSA